MPLKDITTESMRVAFAHYAETHSAASILRCWWTWNVVCTHPFKAELISANPMPQAGRPRVLKSLPKAFPADAVASLLNTLSREPEHRRSDCIERERVLILTALRAGLRSDENVRASGSDIRPGEDGAVIQGPRQGRQRPAHPIEAPLVHVLIEYLDSRAVRFPAST